MEEKNVKGIIYYYSNTGNTKLAVEYVTSRLQGIDFEFVDIVKAMKKGSVQKQKADFTGFAVYTDKLSAPVLFKDFMKTLPIVDGAPAFIFNTCGMFTGRTLPHMKKAAAERGYRVVEGYSLQTPDNHPLFLAMGVTGENHPSREGIAGLDNFTARLQKCVDAYRSGEGGTLKTYIPKSDLVNTLLPPVPKWLIKFMLGDLAVDTEKCNSCGKCAVRCPTGAVSIEKGACFSKDRCTHCYLCFNICPKGAIYNRKIKKIDQYKGPNPKLLKKIGKKGVKIY